MGACCQSSSNATTANSIIKVQSFKRIDSFVVKKHDIISINPGLFSNFYRLGEVIGSGSFGEVRECFTRVDNLKRAVKLIMKSSMD